MKGITHPNRARGGQPVSFPPYLSERAEIMFDPLNPEFDYRCGPGEDHQRMNAADFTGLDTVQFGVISNLTLTALLSDRLLKRVIFETSSLANCEAQSTTFDSCEFYSVKIDQGIYILKLISSIEISFMDHTQVRMEKNKMVISPWVQKMRKVHP